MTTIDICPACGYPKFGSGLCAYCVPVQVMIEDHTFASMPGAGQPRFQSGAGIEESLNETETRGSNQALRTG
jgi:hypothetical protein